MSRLARTSASFYSQNYSPRKINFQTKYKMRGTNQFMQNHQDQNINQPQQKKYQKNVVNHQKQDNDPFKQTCKQLTKTNFSHHDAEKCLCSECMCGRHFCKLHVLKPDLKKSSTYRSSFIRTKSINNHRVSQKQYNKSLPKVQMNSTYSFSFRNKDPTKVIKHHPNDQLSFNGPSQKITSYKNQFPGNKGSNPYVRPRQLFVSGQFPYKNKFSNYKQTFSNVYGNVKSETGKINDQLKTGSFNCFRESFYQEKFQSPNPEDYSSIFKNQEKLQINPNYSHLYQSIYDKDFIATEPVVCPAKIKMQTKYRDSLNNSKSFFNQNTDFKSFSSTYHALSTAPFGQN